jgi:hypothetical protein
MSSFPNCIIDFIYFSYFIALAKISNNILKNNGVSRWPCLIDDFRENVVRFSLIGIIVGYRFAIYSL